MSDTRSTPEDGYTKAQLARYFHCPESTIRYYCARFAPYLPARGDGRGRRYAPSCLEVLAFIRALSSLRSGGGKRDLTPTGHHSRSLQRV